jgi:hypothetical protein
VQSQVALTFTMLSGIKIIFKKLYMPLPVGSAKIKTFFYLAYFYIHRILQLEVVVAAVLVDRKSGKVKKVQIIFFLAIEARFSVNKIKSSFSLK